MPVPHVVMVIPPEKFRDEELFHTKDVLYENNVTVEVVSTTTDEVTGMHGGKIKPSRLLNEVDCNECDALVFVGGAGAIKYFNDEMILGVVKMANEKGKVIAAICIAPSILANAGVLNGKRATAFPSEKNNLESRGATYTGENVTIDGKIITAKGPENAKEFGSAILKVLGESQ